MIRIILIVLLFAIHYPMYAQDDVKSLHATGKSYIRQGDFKDALSVLNRALNESPDNIEVIKDIAFTYYLEKDYPKALETIQPLAKRKDADEQSFQILGMVYNAMDDPKDCEKTYKTAFKKFPKSGSLYNEYGELLWSKSDNNAIKFWEKGIEVEPNYANNYYNACKYYYENGDHFWSALYAEIFVNIEGFSRRTPEIKYLLVDNYRQLFNAALQTESQSGKPNFTQAVLTTNNDQSAAMTTGLSPETITILRSKFVLEWFDKYNNKFPFRLFEYHRQLMKDGLFDAYNQWLFGTVQNLPAFQSWTSSHSEEYTRFVKIQKARSCKLTTGQYYHPSYGKLFEKRK